jgi:hypothetical protein
MCSSGHLSSVKHFDTKFSISQDTNHQYTHVVCLVTCWSLSLWSVQCSLWSLSLWSVQCSLWSLSLCSLPPLCSGYVCPQSLYALTSKRSSSQSLLPLQHSAVSNILQWISPVIKLQLSWHLRCCVLNPKLLQNFDSHSIIFPDAFAGL